jgi:prepilin signal peptidase PulO-like enzyme (type II secretory pathway)
MKRVGRIALGAVIVGTILAVIFYKFTAIQITGGLASLFALAGLLVSWTMSWLINLLVKGSESPPQSLPEPHKAKTGRSGSQPITKEMAKKPSPRSHK